MIGTTAVLVAGMVAAGVAAAAPSASAATSPGYVTTFKAGTTNHLWTIDAAGNPTDTGVVDSTGSPATSDIAAAFAGPDGYLWRMAVAPDGSAGWAGAGLCVSPGTSPAIARQGTWKIAFSGCGNQLWTIDGASKAVPTGAGIAPGTSPAIASLWEGGYETAFVGPDGELWRASPETNWFRVGVGLCVAPGTSPAIAADQTNGWRIAYNACDSHHLATVDSTGFQHDTGAPMAPDASPSMAFTSGGGFTGFQIAYRGSNGLLFRAFPDTNWFQVGAGLGVAPGTNPSIACDPYGSWKIAFNADGGNHLWTVDAAGQAIDTQLGLAANSSPSIAALPVVGTGGGGGGGSGGGNTNPPHSATLTVTEQQVSQGFVPYAGVYPSFGSVPPFHLISIRFPLDGFSDLTLWIVKPGHSTQECNDPNALVKLQEGATTTPAQITAIYGQAQPHFTTLAPLGLVACLAVGGSSLQPAFIALDMTIQND